MLDFMNEVFSRGNKMGVALNNELTRSDHEQSLLVSRIQALNEEHQFLRFPEPSDGQ